MARPASGAVYVDILGDASKTRQLLTAQFKAMKPFKVPVQLDPNFTGFRAAISAKAKQTKPFLVPVQLNPSFVGFRGRLAKAVKAQKPFMVPVRMTPSLTGFKKAFKEEFDKTGLSKTGLKVPVDLGGAGLDETTEKMKKANTETRLLSERFRAFGLITGVAPPKIIALAASIGPLIQVTSALTAALIPAAGLLGAVPALALSGAVAVGTLKLATAGFGDAVKEAFTGNDPKKMQEFLSKLSPNARAGVMALVALRPQLRGLQKDVQNRFFAGFADDVRLTGAVYLPMLRRELPLVAAGMSGWVENLAAGAREAPAIAGIRDVIHQTGRATAVANNNIRGAVGALGLLASAGAPKILAVGQAFDSATARFTNYVTAQAQAGQITVWIDDAIATTKTLGGVFGNVGSIIWSVLSAANSQGAGFLVTLENLTGQGAAFLQSTQGIEGLTGLFVGVSAFGGAIGDVATVLLPALGETMVILAPAIQDAAPAMADLAIAAVPLIPALARLAVGVLPPLVDILQLLITPLVWVANGLSVVFGWMGKNKLVSAFVATIVAGVVAFKLFVTVVKIIAFVTKAWAVAQFILNAAWAANPVGVVIIAIVALAAALVLAYKRSETFRNIVQTVFSAIATAGKWLWETILKPIFNGLVWYLENVVFPVWRFMWTNVIKPVFGFISAAVGVWWTVVKAVFTAVVWTLQNFVFPWFEMLWTRIIKPVFGFIGAYIGFVWDNLIKPIWTALVWYISNVILPAFRVAWTVIKAVWNGIGSAITWVWDHVIKPAFNFLKDAVMNKIPAAFRVGRDAVGKAWDAIKDIAKKPIKFVIETVINKGIIGAYNWVASKFGVKKADDVPLPKGFAIGGIVPGYQPGIDTVPAMLSKGEGILRPEVVRALGPEIIHEWNRKARRGEIRGFADGGVIGRPKGVGGPFDWLKSAAEMITDPVGAFKKKIGLDGLLKKVPGGDFGQLIASVPRKIVNFIIDKVKGFFDAGTASGSLRSGSGTSIGMLHNIAKMFYPGARVSSGFRPGDPGHHGSGLAADLVGGGAAGMRTMAAGFYQLAPNLLELIHTPGGYFVKNGQRRDVYNAAIKRDHYDHVHVAATTGALKNMARYDDGGWLQPGRTLTYNGTGKPEAVLTDKQWKAITAGAKGGDTNYNIAVQNAPDKPTTKAIHDVMRRTDLLYGKP